MRTRTLRAVLVAGLVLALPTSAKAATASISNEAGADVPLTAPTTVTTMAPTLKLQFADTERRYSVKVTGPAGTDAVAPVSCLNVAQYDDLSPTYQGNGTYTVAVTTTVDPSDLACASGQTIVYSYAVEAGAAVSPPRGSVLTRRGETVLSHDFGVSATAGTDIVELQVARNVRPQADGGLPGAPRTIAVSAEAKSAAISFARPGRYAVIARPKRGDAVGPWSAPVYVDVYAPFDFAAAPAFKDGKGPKYVITANVRPAVPRGSEIKVYTKARTDRKYKKLAVVKTRSNGRFKVKFETLQTGRIRFQYRFKGTDRVARGKVTAVVKLVGVRV